MSSGSHAIQALSDEELVNRYKSTGKPEYFAQIFARHRTIIYCACRRFFGATGLAEDATQEAFVRAFQSIKSFTGGNVRGWLMHIARNVCIDHWRKQRRQQTTLTTESLEEPEAPRLDHVAQLQEALAKVREEMKVLTPEQRSCLELKMEGYTYEETAQRTGLPVNAVKSHLQNGRRMLWARLQGILSQLP